MEAALRGENSNVDTRGSILHEEAEMENSKDKNTFISLRSVGASEQGSLALEHILFIGAIVALSAGLFIFYNNISNYFANIGFSAPPTNLGGSAAPGAP